MNPGGQWYYLSGSETLGPVTQDQLLALIRGGSVPASALVAGAGWTQWQPASSVFAQQLAPAPAPVPVAAVVSKPPAPAPTAVAAVQLRCVAGPDAGKVFVISSQETMLGRTTGLVDPQAAPQHVAFSWQSNMLNFRAGTQGATIQVGGQTPGSGVLLLGQQFNIGASTWEVSSQSFTLGGLLDSVGNRLNSLASTEKLEGFSLGEMFSEVFKSRTQEEVDEYFICGTTKTTPPIERAQTGWPKPWFFMRVLIFMGLIYFGFLFAWNQFGNANLLPGLMMMGSLVVPLATTILFFELNTPRNISFHYTLGLLCVGGVVSIFLSLIGFKISALSYVLGPPAAGIVEEVGKLLTVILVARNLKHKYVLNGLLFGAAVGAGFAVFESAGYAFRAFMSVIVRGVNSSLSDAAISAIAGGNMTSNITIRALLSPFCHVAWTAISAGALWRIKGDRAFSFGMLTQPAFLRAFLIPVALHMIWNAPFITDRFFIKHAILGAAGWFVLFGIIQQGLKQVRAAQLEQAREELSRTQSAITAVTGSFAAVR